MTTTRAPKSSCERAESIGAKAVRDYFYRAASWVQSATERHEWVRNEDGILLRLDIIYDEE